MTRRPVTDDRGEFAHLHGERQRGVVEQRFAQKVFVEAGLDRLVGGIETAVDPGLGEEVEPRADVHVEEEGQAGIEEEGVLRFKQSGRGPRQEISLQVEQAAEFPLHLTVKGGERQVLVQRVQRGV